ncbi:hypothetical protein ACWDR3_43365 [Streptomyces sp. NPDC001002]
MDDSLSFESFLAGAKKAANDAVDEHGRGDYDDFALYGGVAIEKLAKAVLVSKNPIYIAEVKGSAEMLFHLGGHRTAAKVRTIGVSEAVARLRTLGVLAPDRQLDLLIDLRNGTAHTTVGEQAKALLPTLAENVAVLLSEVGLSTDEFWDRWTSLVNVAVDRERSAIQRDVEIRIKQARHLFDDRFSGLPVAAKEQILEEFPPDVGFPIKTLTVSDSQDRLTALFVSTICPACGGQARLRLNHVGTSSTGVSLIPDWLGCGMCNLKLEGQEELAASGADVEKAALPGGIHFTWGATLPLTLKIGETYAG